MAGIPSASRVGLVLYPAKKTLFEYITDAIGGGGGDDAMDAVLGRAGLEPVRAALKDPRLRVWMHGGMMRMTPFAFEFH
jgi:hypothetical protein